MSLAGKGVKHAQPLTTTTTLSCIFGPSSRSGGCLSGAVDCLLAFECVPAEKFQRNRNSGSYLVVTKLPMNLALFLGGPLKSFISLIMAVEGGGHEGGHKSRKPLLEGEKETSLRILSYGPTLGGRQG